MPIFLHTRQKDLKEYWSEYGHKVERPIFLGVDLSIMEVDSVTEP